MQLNPVQEAIANSHAGPVLAIAVAGSGKTTAIVENIRRKHKLGVDLRRVMMLTFNKDASEQIKNRLKDILPKTAPFGTSHAVFLRILRASFPWRAERVPTWQLKNICTSVIDKDKFKEGDEQIFQHLIGLAKGNLGTTLRPSAYPIVEATMEGIKGFQADYTEAEAIRVMETYEKYCVDNSYYDFDDILLWSYYYFMDNDIKRKAYQEHFTHVIVDEYQDTNRVQQHLYEMMAELSGNILCVGDDDQNIYAFRGSGNQYLLDFENTWPGATLLKLEDNYRSKSEIIQASNNLISWNEQRFHKYAICNRGRGGQFNHLARTATEEEEARTVAESIQHLYNEEIQYGNMCILTRTNAQQGPLEDALTNHNIPFTVNGGVSFYERKEISLCTMYAKVAGGQDHGLLLPYLANRPSRYIRKTTYEKFKSLAHVRAELGTFHRGVTQYYTDLERCVEQFKNTQHDMGQFFEWLISSEGIGLLLHFRGLIEDEGGTESVAQKNLRQLVSMTQGISFSMYLDQIRRNEEMKSVPIPDGKVTVSTIHKSKGLEWDCVFIMGLNGHILPNSKSDIEEERRLMYVAMTRARDRLYLTAHGEKDSCFIDNIRTQSHETRHLRLR